jgi:hypothetical protein
MIKKFFRPIIPQILLNLRNELIIKRQLKAWQKNGSPYPPPHIVKQMAIAEYQQKYRHTLLVETGTHLGDMVEAQRTKFKKIISIELGIDLFEQAQERFKNYTNITIVQGDSGKVLPKILNDIHEPAIFWLDGHYSAGITAKGDKESPIFEELDAILNSNNKYEHVLLIDDARCFNGEGDYPTIEKLTAYFQSKNDRYWLEVKHDIIRFVI